KNLSRRCLHRAKSVWRPSAEARADFLLHRDIAWRAPGAAKPGLEVRYPHVVERRVADFDAQRAGIERLFAAPAGPAELLQRHGARLVEALGGYRGDVFDAFAVAKADDAFAELSHAREHSISIRFVFANGILESGSSSPAFGFPVIPS